MVVIFRAWVKTTQHCPAAFSSIFVSLSDDDRGGEKWKNNIRSVAAGPASKSNEMAKKNRSAMTIRQHPGV